MLHGTGWSETDITPKRGAVAIVTGANSGLGYHTARVLAGAGAKVVMACRSTERATEAAELINASVPDADLVLASLDLADLESVRSFAEEIRTGYEHLDLLVNNAGVMAVPSRHETAQGFELQFGTNHLGHFALTGLLLSLLRDRQGARIVTLSSNAHRMGRFDFDDLDSTGKYTRWGAYGRSKLANLSFALELDRRLREADARAISLAAHPGYARTHLTQSGPGLDGAGLATRVVGIADTVIAQPATRGALPQLYAAAAPGVEGGQYYGPRFAMWGKPSLERPSARARDVDAAQRLWDVSVERTGVEFDV